MIWSTNFAYCYIQSGIHIPGVIFSVCVLELMRLFCWSVATRCKLVEAVEYDRVS